MLDRCALLQGNFQIVGVVEEGDNVHLSCLRPRGHDGAHLIKRSDQVGGEYVAWVDDPCNPDKCDCGLYEDDDHFDDVCIAFGVVGEEEVQRLIENADYDPFK